MLLLEGTMVIISLLERACRANILVSVMYISAD